jgi:hypothetical protein
MRVISETAVSRHGVDARNKSGHDEDSVDQTSYLGAYGRDARGPRGGASALRGRYKLHGKPGQRGEGEFAIL